MLKKYALHSIAPVAIGLLFSLASQACFADATKTIKWEAQNYTLCKNDTHNGNLYFCLTGPSPQASPDLIVNGTTLSTANVQTPCGVYLADDPHFPGITVTYAANAWDSSNIVNFPVSWCYDDTNTIRKMLANGQTEYEYRVYRFPGFKYDRIKSVTNYPK